MLKAYLGGSLESLKFPRQFFACRCIATLMVIFPSLVDCGWDAKFNASQLETVESRWRVILDYALPCLGGEMRGSCSQNCKNSIPRLSGTERLRASTLSRTMFMSMDDAGDVLALGTFGIGLAMVAGPASEAGRQSHSRLAAAIPWGLFSPNTNSFLHQCR